MTRLLLIILVFPLFLSAQPTFNVKDYGATGKKSELATSAIQAAIDAAAEQGGGQVYLPPGEYLSGTLVLKDNITLWIEAGATLFGSREEEDYSSEHKDHFGNPVLLYAQGVSRVTLRGKGVVNGQAVREYRELERVDRFIKEETEIAREAGVEMKMFYKVKPYTSLLYFMECQDLTFEDLSFVESNFWTLHLQCCQRVFMRGLYVYSDLESGVNADGIDITGCQDVTISDCIVITGDDGICLKSKYIACPVENVTVTNCIVSSSSTALKIGTDTHGDFRHIIFSNCVVRNSNRGLSIVVRDGSVVSDVLFSDIIVECKRRHFNWWGDGDPISVLLLKRGVKSIVGKIENVRFNNIIATGEGTSRIESRVEHPIKGISLHDVSIHMRPESKPDKRATHALEIIAVDDLAIENLQVSWETDSAEAKWEHDLYLESIHGLKINGFEGQGIGKKGVSPIYLNQVKHAMIQDVESTGKVSHLIRVSGEESAEILIKDSNLQKKADRLLRKGENVAKKGVKVMK